jgi:hypothetical protein
MAKIKSLIFSFILTITFVSPVLVLAQTTATSSATSDVPQYSGVQQSISDYLCTPSETADGRDLERCINKLYRFGIAFGAIALVFFVVVAGYLYITGGEKGKGQAKGMLQNTAVGIGLLAGSYVILSFINPNIVLFKPIQPPIFTANDLPSCEAVGLGVNCTVQDGNDSTSNAGTGWGADMTCPAGQIVSAKVLGLPTKSDDEQICKPFGEKLLALNTSLAGIKWRITDTIGPGHVDPCHSSGSPVSGTCADIGLEPSDRTDGNWDKVCQSVLAISNLQPVNEVIGAGTRLPHCPKEADYKRTGSNVHVNWKVGTGGGSSSGGGNTTSSKCGTSSSLPGVCGWTGSDPYNLDWGSNSDLKAKFEAFNAAWKAKGGSTLYAIQAYRPQDYTNHIRSVWEANQLVNKKKTVSQIASQGYGCSGRTSSFMTDAQAKAYTSAQISQLNTEVSRHGSNSDTPPACASDHEKGIAVDVSTSSGSRTLPSDYAGWIATGISVGLCHNIAGDEPHFALKASLPSGTTCNLK